MKKKLIKLSKKIICVLMIISFILPCFASTSKGDDGAFVTKEEFDKALSDFNNRLSAFEAGINAKIDSQVTSYLDRNGIWSPVKQTTKNVDFQYKELCNYGANYVKKYIQNTNGTEMILSTNEIIESITKTGMIYLSVTWNCSWNVELHQSNSTVPTWSHALFEGAGKGLLGFGVYKKDAAGTSYFEEYNNLPGFIRVVAGPSGDGTKSDGSTNPNANDGDVIITGGEAEIVTMFFVEKGEKLYCRPKLCWGGRSNTNNNSGNWDSNGGCSINGVKTSTSSTNIVRLLFTADVY